MQIIKSPHGRDYTLQRKVNEGGYGEVYLAKRDDNLEVAAKFIKPGPFFPAIWNSWVNECQLSLKCLHHRHIVQIYEYFRTNQNHLVIIMEKAHESLSDQLEKGYRFSVEAICGVGTQILSALEHIHLQNVIHRDVTPKNILVFPGSTYKLSDFGIAKNTFYTGELERTLIGWSPYRPPEFLIPGRHYSSLRSDLYQLGLILLTLMLGEPPISQNLSQQQIDQQILSGIPRQKAEALAITGGKAGQLAMVVSIMLRRRDEYRYSSAWEVHNELLKVLNHQ
ncbi:MAG: protein kinase [Acidobacteriota bacterium]|nr:protein kinase [Acidobacteriota bacterium]